VGDPDRVEAVSHHFDSIEFTCQHREFVTHTGYIGKKRLSVVSTGIGPDNIDIVLNELDALVNIDMAERIVKPQHTPLNIIRVGTSGALQAQIPVDSFVVSTHGLGIDNLLNFYRHQENDEEKQLLQAFITQTQLNSRISHPYISRASTSLIKHFVKDFHHGITVTCPGFYGPQGRILRLGLSNPDLIERLTQFSFGPHRITNFEMETSGIYGLSAIVANRVSKTFSKDGNQAVQQLITKTLEVVSGLGF
jgi:uridine phosphorylase